MTSEEWMAFLKYFGFRKWDMPRMDWTLLPPQMVNHEQEIVGVIREGMTLYVFVMFNKKGSKGSGMFRIELSELMTNFWPVIKNTEWAPKLMAEVLGKRED